MKILIADDDFVARAILNTSLSDYGTIDEAENGAQAIDLFDKAYAQDAPYDVVLLDKVMPEKDGDEVLRHIKNTEEFLELPSEKRCKVVMITGVNKPDSVFSSFKDQCDAYIIKPIEPRKVVDAFHSAGIQI